MLQTVVSNAVKDREEALTIDAVKLEAVVTYNIRMGFAGVPIGGQHPGTEFLSAPLAGAAALQEIREPYLDRPPTPDTYVTRPNVPGLEAAIAKVQQRNTIDQVIGTSQPEMVRADVMTQALGELGTAVNTSLSHAPQLQKTAMEVLLGDDMGAGIIGSIQRVTDNGPYSVKQLLEVCKEQELYDDGVPNMPWPAETMFITKQTIWSARQATRQEESVSRQGPVTGQPAQPPRVQQSSQEQASSSASREQLDRPAQPTGLPTEAPVDYPALAVKRAGELFDEALINGEDRQGAIRTAVNGFVTVLALDQQYFGPRILQADIGKFIQNVVTKAEHGYTMNEANPRDGVENALRGVFNHDEE